MESTQLRNIQNIENSLSLLKFKIEKMAQLDSKKEEDLSRLILSTVPVVNRKIKEQKYQAKLQAKKSVDANNSAILKMKNQESRLINSKEISRSKEIITTMKIHNSMHLKQSKKINEEKIKKIKQLDLKQKKSQKLKVREEEIKCKIRVQEFYEHKSRDIRERREQQNQYNQLRIQQLMQELVNLSHKEQQMSKKLKQSEENVSKFKEVIKEVDKMKCQDFRTLKNKVIKPQVKKVNSRSLSEAILLYTTNK